MIPRNVRSKDLVGQYVRTTKPIMNGAGVIIPKGTKVKVQSVGRCFTIMTDVCLCCGLQACIRGVTRDEVELF